MLRRQFCFVVWLALLLLVGNSNSFAHCDLAYSAGPKIIYHPTPQVEVESRASITKLQAGIAAKKTSNSGSPRVYADLTSSDVQDEIPKSNSTDPATRQRLLTYWLLYVQKLYDEERYQDVVSTISDLRRKSLLWDVDAEGGYDDGDVRTEAYFSIANLTRIFLAYENPAKLALLSENGFGKTYLGALEGTIETQGTTFNFDHLYSFSAIDQLRKTYLPRVPERALRPGAQFAQRHANEKRWRSIASLQDYEAILGISRDIPSQTHMYVQGGTTMGTIVVNEESAIVTLETGLDCRSEYQTSLRFLGKFMQTGGNNNTVLAGLVKAADRFVLTFSPDLDHVYITESELTALISGKKIDDSDSESLKEFNNRMLELQAARQSLVLWSHPMMQKKGAARDATIHFASYVARVYPNLNIVIDDPNPRVPELARKIAELSIAPKDVWVVIDTQLGVKFQGELADSAQQIRQIINKENVVIFNGSEPSLPPSTSERAVIVITGHADSALEAFVDRLAEKGYLKNNFVVFQSCGNELSPKLVSKINDEYGAAGTFHYPVEILETDAVAHTLDILKDVTTSGQSFGHIVRERAAKPSKPWERAMDGAWTICLKVSARMLGFS